MYFQYQFSVFSAYWKKLKTKYFLRMAWLNIKIWIYIHYISFIVMILYIFSVLFKVSLTTISWEINIHMFLKYCILKASRIGTQAFDCKRDSLWVRFTLVGIRYLIFPFPCSGVGRKRGVERPLNTQWLRSMAMQLMVIRS